MLGTPIALSTGYREIYIHRIALSIFWTTGAWGRFCDIKGRGGNKGRLQNSQRFFSQSVFKARSTFLWPFARAFLTLAKIRVVLQAITEVRAVHGASVVSLTPWYLVEELSNLVAMWVESFWWWTQNLMAERTHPAVKLPDVMLCN